MLEYGSAVQQLTSMRVIAVAGILLCLLGCSNTSRVRQQRQPISSSTEVAQPAPPPAVFFTGSVKNPAVSWTEGLSLSQALLAAEYQGLWDPRVIYIIRRGQRYRVNPKDLLRGAEDPQLEPNDRIEVER